MGRPISRDTRCTTVRGEAEEADAKGRRWRARRSQPGAASRRARRALLVGIIPWLLTALTGLRPPRQGEIRRFRPGLDYTVAHHGILTVDPRLDATMCVVDDEGHFELELGFQRVGGPEYIAADEEGEAGGAATDEVYNAAAEEDEDGLLSVSATFNTLSRAATRSDAVRQVRVAPRAVKPMGHRDAVHVEDVEDSDDEEDEEEDEGERAARRVAGREA